MNSAEIRNTVDGLWDSQIVPQLIEYIKIPNKSPMFDADWQKHGYMDQAVALMEKWARAQPIAGMQLEVVRLPGRTPLIFIDIPGRPQGGLPHPTTRSAGGPPLSRDAGEGLESAAEPPVHALGDGADDDCVLLYGHLDKQPEMTGWAEHLGPWKPVLEGDKLYGRGGADDGYAIFGSLAAILALRQQNVSHARCVVLIEACEESGSYDLPYYVDHLAGRIGKPSLVVCLDSGCANYEQLWLTTSLRGLAGGNLTVKVLEEGVHSGDASGVVASSFRILRSLLSRLEDQATGQILPEELHVEIPPQRVEQARQAVKTLGTAVYDKFPFVKGMKPMNDDLAELVLNRTWRPALSVTGVDGVPPLSSAGNVLRPYTAVKLSLRIPPTLDAAIAGKVLRELMEKDPPYGAKVTCEVEKASAGWNAPQLSPWLEASVDAASKEFFGQPPAYMGEGGTIPFMGMLGEKFPGAQFLITGVLGPGSNAHGPNEFLHIPMGKRVSACVAKVVADHYQASRQGLTMGVAAATGHGQHGDHGCC